MTGRALIVELLEIVAAYRDACEVQYRPCACDTCRRADDAIERVREVAAPGIAYGPGRAAALAGPVREVRRGDVMVLIDPSAGFKLCGCLDRCVGEAELDDGFVCIITGKGAPKEDPPAQ